MKKTNSMYFTDKEEAIKFIDTLHQISLNDEEYYNDIHTYVEESAIIVEWEQVPYDKSFGGTFQYVDEGDGETIMLEREFPDKHYDYFHSEEEFKEALDKWYKKEE